VRFEAVTAMALKSTTFWDKTQGSVVKFYLHFGGTYCLHLQGLKVNQVNRKKYAE
jgi:hypothetical protein